eukprot:COSAG02_NODE_71074_length_192_cov_87.946237_1_plen_26_part_10
MTMWLAQHVALAGVLYVGTVVRRSPL